MRASLRDLDVGNPFILRTMRTLEGVAIGIRGRHELFVSSLVALLTNRGANVHVLEQFTPGDVSERGIDVIVLESPFGSEVEEACACGLPIVTLVERTDSDAALGALRLGAHSLVAKNAPLAELSIAIKRALEARFAEPPATLTSRQQEVLKLITDGLDNAQIARRLNISTRTARAHVSGVLERLGVENRTQAAVTAVRQGWVG